MSTYKSLPIIFLGIADHIESTNQPFPVGSIDIFQLSQHKVHIIFPAFTKENLLVFSLNMEMLPVESHNRLKVRLIDEEGKNLIEIGLSTTPGKVQPVDGKHKESGESYIPIIQGTLSTLLYVKLDVLVTHPGKYIVQTFWENEYIEIGNIYFHYQPTPSLTYDQIKAFELDPISYNTILIKLGCKSCSTMLNVYAALERQSKFENEGFIWQSDVSEEFKCDCGKTNYSLRFIKESLHGLLLKRLNPKNIGLSYVRRFAHTQVVSTVKEFNRLLDSKKDEKPFQKFIENHPIMLAKFHAKRLFIKPNILGKFETDFAILNTSNHLLLIELERPSLLLFKKDGHPTAYLMHAYGQVKDWLFEYSKHRGAVLEGLKLKPDQVVAVKGVVIGGRTSLDIFEPLQRHISSPPYPDIEFLTLDDLSKSLLEISRTLA